METLAGILLSAALLGFTHGIEPDHVAGVTALASDGGPRRAGVVGACFAVGHVALVAVWVAVGSTVVGGLPVAPLDGFGNTALGLVLLAVALVTVRAGLGSLRGRDDARVGAALVDRRGRPDSVRGYLAVGLVGALFTLSPPLSMLAFVTGVLPTAGPAGAWAAVLAYAAAIVATMAGAGLVAGGAFDALDARGARPHGAGQLLAGGAVGALGLLVLAV